MKKLNETYFTAAVYAFGVIAFSVLFLIVCLNFGIITSAIGSFLSGIASILYAILFALLLFPAVKRFDGLYDRLFCKKRKRPLLVSGFSIGTTFILALSIVAVTLIVIIPRLLDDATKLFTFVKGTKERLDAYIAENSADLPFLLDIYEAVTAFLFGDTSDGGTSSFFQQLIAPISKILSSIVGQVSSVFMGLIIAVYFLATRRVISGIVGKLVVAIIPEKHVTRFVLFFKRIYSDFATFTFNRFIIAFLFAALVGLVCWLMRVPLLSVIVLLVLLSHMIPVIGPIIGNSAAVLLTILLKGPWLGLLFTLIIILLEIFSTNVLLINALPKKLRPPYGVTAVVVLLSLTLFNVIGAFLSVPLYASISMEIRRFVAHRLSKRGLPLSSEAYANFDSKVYEKILQEKKEKEDASPTASAEET